MIDKLAIPLAFIVLLGLVTTIGFFKGASHERDKYKLIMQDQRDELNEIRSNVKNQEKKHAKKVQTLEDSIQRAKDQYDLDIDRIASDSSKRLHEAETRIAYYRSIGDMQEAGTSGCESLAGITEAYDRQLTEGIGMVEELRASSQRVLSDLKTLTELVELDRKHINE